MKQLVADCVVIGARVSTATMQKIASAATTLANSMVENHVNSNEIRKRNFSLKVTTSFENKTSHGVYGYSFEVQVSYRNQRFTMRLTISPLVFSYLSKKLQWDKYLDETLVIKKSWIEDFIRNEA